MGRFSKKRDMNMDNSASHDSLVAKKISLCKERRSHLERALDRRPKLASAQLKFHGCHEEFANDVRTFIEKQNPSSSEASQDRNEQVEDNDNEDEIMENVNEGALITRRQGNIIEVERMGGLRFLKALEGVEKQFRNAYASGKDVSEKLEANNLVSKSASSQSMRLVRSLSRSNSRISCSTFLKVEVMGKTLGEIASWEDKLHKELKNLKAETKKTKLKRQNLDDSSDENNLKTYVNCTTAEQAANNNSKEIARLRNEYFLPRLGEQLDGLRRNWRAMSEFYQSQKRILSQVEESPDHPLLCEDSHQQATKQLKKQLCNWLNCFKSYVSKQKKYIESLCWWLYKNEISIIVGDIDGGRWDNLERLESYKKEVVAQMIVFKKDVAALLVQQSKEHEKKKEIERLEQRVYIKRDMINEVNEKQTLEEIEKLEHRIKKTKEKHQSKMRETQKMLNEFQKGFSNLFEKLADFSSEAAKIYDELINHLP